MKTSLSRQSAVALVPTTVMTMKKVYKKTNLIQTKLHGLRLKKQKQYRKLNENKKHCKK